MTTKEQGYWNTAASEEAKAIRAANEGRHGDAAVASERNNLYTRLALEEYRSKKSWWYRVFGD